MSDRNSEPRRNTADGARNRVVLLDAAEQLILEEGYAAVTARRVATKAGLKPQLVHYYFVSMDDLLVGIIRRGAERTNDMFDAALESPRPLHALWMISNNPRVTTLSTELVAAARHRTAIRAELTAAAERFRRAQAAALEQIIERYEVDTGGIPIGVLALLIESLIRTIAAGADVGITAFHDDALAFIQAQIDRCDGAAGLFHRSAEV